MGPLAQSLWTGDAGVPTQDKQQQQVCRMGDADAHRNQRHLLRKAVVADLQRRGRMGEVEPIMFQASQSKRLAEPARAGSKLARCCAAFQPSIPRHAVEPGERLQGAEEHAASQALRLAGNIGAEITAIDRIDIRVPGRAEENRIPRRGSAVGVGSGIGRLVVGTEIGFDFDNPAGEAPTLRPMHKHLAQQARRHQLWRSFEEAAREQSAAYLCDFFHSLINASTSSAWPSGVTLGKMCSRVLSGPMRNVVLSIPHTFLPYMFFSFITPNRLQTFSSTSARSV